MKFKVFIYSMVLWLVMSCEKTTLPEVKTKENSSDEKPLVNLNLPIEVSKYSPQILNEIKRNQSCFTQGLVFIDSLFYESCGLYKESKIQISNLKGEVKFEKNIEAKYFAEGLSKAIGQGWLQLTWKSGEVFLWDEKFENSISLSLPSIIKEGWGIINHNDNYWVSNGSEFLFQLDRNLNVLNKLKVSYKNESLKNLNELEWVNGYLVANVWQTTNVVVIDPMSGQVIELWDLGALQSKFTSNELSKMDVPNGIAYDVQNKRLWVTGKLWPKIFEIDITSSILTKP